MFLNRYTLIFALVSGSLFSVANANTGPNEITYEISCENAENILKNINKNLPENKKLNIECQETYETALFGLVQKNFEAKIQLSSQADLCYSPIGGEFHDTILDYPAHIGTSRMQAINIEEVLYDHGIKAKFSMSGSNVGTLYGVKSLNFPICE